MYTSIGNRHASSGAQLDFELEEGCDLALSVFESISRDQVTTGAHDGCIRCRRIQACIQWAASQNLITSDHNMIRTTYEGNLKLFGTSYSAPVVVLQCWKQVQSPEIRETWGRTMAYTFAIIYGGPESRKAPSNAQCLPLPSKTSSRQTFAFIQNQLDACTLHHKECRSDVSQSATALQKFRILEIQDTHLKLVPAKPGHRYACLSHCWGKAQSVVKTTRATLEVYCTSGVSLADLPKTFRDAVRICCKLNISCIWIDSLCIVQDDSNDWFDQAGRMASIFDNAYLTIAASKAKDSRSGCFGKVDRVHRGLPLPGFDKVFIRRTVPLPLHTGWRAAKDPDPTEEDNKSLKRYWPLLTRAWVFQEILLSKRVIHYGVNEVIWQCGSKIQHQGTIIPRYVVHPTSVLPKMLRSNDDSVIVDHVLSWHDMVSDYCKRELTFSKDRLPALAAVARYMSGLRQNDAYLAGLWHHTLIYDLTWSVVPCHNMRSRLDIPTWSWAKCSTPVGWSPTVSEGKRFANTDVLTTVCTTEGGPFTGRTKEAAILIQAALIPLKDIRPVLDIFHSRGLDSNATKAAGIKNSFQSLDIFNVQIPISWDQTPESTILSESEAFALPLIRFEKLLPGCVMVALLIQKTDIVIWNDQIEDSRYGKACYKRIGIVQLQLEGDRGLYSADQFIEAQRVYMSALVERVEAMETHVVTLI